MFHLNFRLLKFLVQNSKRQQFQNNFFHSVLYLSYITFVPGSYSSEAVFLGGPRFVTFMIFMTSVEAGGHTVFPQPGISVQPEQGSALYWFNMGSQNNLDSRIRHLGCPVLYGNKWIANKWIKWFSNFKKYPCLINQKNYSILEHHF